MQVELLNDQGLASSKVDVPDTVFGREYNESLIHQVVVAFQANARQGTRAHRYAPRCAMLPLHKTPASLLPSFAPA